MNAKSRVHAALNRERTDRVPVWMWLHPETVTRLGELLEIPPGSVSEALGDDIRQSWVGNNHAMEGIVHAHDGERHKDFWGVEWVKQGPFNQIACSPLQQAHEKDILDYRYPYEHIDALLANMDPVVALGRDFFIGCDVSPCLFEMVCRIRGMEGASLDLAASPQLSQTMLEQAGAFAVRLAENACDRFAVDWLWTGDDVGGQTAMMMHPQCWRDKVGPHLSRIFDVAQTRSLWVAYHSCGSIRPIIGDLIEMGLNVLNPVQCGCPGMDPFELKKEYGAVLSFMGGLDTQYLLPRGSESQVCRSATRLVEEMSEGGGYILAGSHAVPPETPIENLLAAYRAAGITREEIFDRAADLRTRREA